MLIHSSTRTSTTTISLVSHSFSMPNSFLIVLKPPTASQASLRATTTSNSFTLSSCIFGFRLFVCITWMDHDQARRIGRQQSPCDPCPTRQWSYLFVVWHNTRARHYYQILYPTPLWTLQGQSKQCLPQCPVPSFAQFSKRKQYGRRRGQKGHY